jgi:DNA-binding NtrC family response regulator
MSHSVQFALPQLLLVEPDRIVRSTVASVCRGLDLAQVHQAASVAIGAQMLQAQRMGGLLLSLAEGDSALALIERVRAKRPELPVAVMATSADAAAVQRLKALRIRRLLLQPFKIRDVVMTIESLCEHAALESPGAA